MVERLNFWLGIGGWVGGWVGGLFVVCCMFFCLWFEISAQHFQFSHHC